MNETLSKYLAGLFDADGSIGMRFYPLSDGTFRLNLRVTVLSAENIDRTGFVRSLPQKTGVGSVTYTDRSDKGWANTWTFDVCARSDLEKFIPHIAKHMVVKGRHFDKCLKALRETQGQRLTLEDKERYKLEFQLSREDVGPIKPKKHPTWAWVAGFLDGDGHYSLRHQKQGRKTCTSAHVGAVCQLQDRTSLDLLYKTFGGHLRLSPCKKYLRWKRNLGPRDAKFALPFLRKMVNRSVLKKHKIEQIIHNTQQRLSKITPKGDATV